MAAGEDSVPLDSSSSALGLFGVVSTRVRRIASRWSSVVPWEDWKGLCKAVVPLFMLYSTRILFVWPLWAAPFIPVLSPLWKQAALWSASSDTYVAILLHVAGGISMMACATLQFDSDLRHR